MPITTIMIHSSQSYFNREKTENAYLLIARAAVNTLSKKRIAAAVDRVQCVRH